MGEPAGTGAQRDGDAPQGQGAVTPGWEPAARGAPGGLVPVPSGRGDRKGPAAQHNGLGRRSGCSPSWPALQDTTVQVSSAAGTRGPREREEDEDFPARMSPAPCSSPGWEEGRRHRLRFPMDRPSPNRQRRARTQLAATHRSPGAVPTAPTQPPAGRAPRARQHKRPRAGPCSLLSRSGNSNSFKMSGSVGASERAARRARAGLRTSRKAARTARAGAALLWLRGRRSRAGSSSPGTPQGSRELKSEKKKKQISSNLL